MKFNNTKPVKDLLWYDGPLLSIFKQDEQFFLVMWVDVDVEHRWFAIEVDAATLQEYCDSKLTLLEVMQKSNGIYDAHGQFIGTNDRDYPKTPFAEIPKDLLPTEDSYLHEISNFKVCEH